MELDRFAFDQDKKIETPHCGKLFIDYSKIGQIRINNSAKGKSCIINSQFLQNWEGK